jgi:heme exporter protein C
MFSILKKLGSPRQFYHFCGTLLPVSILLCCGFLAYGLVGGLLLSPPDYQQGDGYRIIFVHVPCALLSMVIYGAIAFYSALYLIWRVKVADIIAYCLAPIGAFFTLSALVTGAIWGKPMWGTWWIWDARLTSELILLFLYLGYIGLYNAIEQPKVAAKAGAILAIVGIIDVPIIHYSVNWWSTLHQGSTLLKRGAPAIHPSMLYPLLSMILAFVFYTAIMACIRIRTEILHRESESRWVVALFNKVRRKNA